MLTKPIQSSLTYIQQMSELQLGASTLSQLTAHTLYFHAPLVALRLPSRFDCKLFAERWYAVYLLY
jgi:hypothetical protein